MSVWKSSLSSKIYKERENTSSKFMKARARSRHLKRLQQTFYDADYVTDGRLIYEYVHATDADLHARARALHISITLHDDEDDEEEEDEDEDEEDDGGGEDDNKNGNSNSTSTSSTSSSITVRATNTPDNTLAPRWVRVSSLEQFIVSEARCRMSNEETAELARLFLQLVPVLARSPLPLPPQHATSEAPSEATQAQSTSETASMAPAMLEALQFVALKRSIDAYLQHGIGSGSGSGGPPSASSQDTRKEKRPTAPNSLWTVQDGMHIYLAHRIAVSETFASHPPSSRQLRHSQWYGARADQQPQPGHVLAIDAFVRTSFRHAFPQIVADLDNGRRDDADVRRICLAGEFYVRERVPLVAHECIPCRKSE
jgi:hypothetical protein